MNECEYAMSRVDQGANCANSGDLVRYLSRVAAETHRLRNGLSAAVSQVFAGVSPPGGLGEDLPYPADRVERLLFDDLMGADVLVGDPALATALRQTMRLLEDAAHATHLACSLIERPCDTATGQPLSGPLYATRT
ncbi:hypothetical protein [Streptomyces sp. NPDC058653]|uniref:hypothetical protein n=1 Tax=Streptomyces sp. NPDC058653 TaxID=3346576 RepID=UPI003660D7CA